MATTLIAERSESRQVDTSLYHVSGTGSESVYTAGGRVYTDGRLERSAAAKVLLSVLDLTNLKNLHIAVLGAGIALYPRVLEYVASGGSGVDIYEADTDLIAWLQGTRFPSHTWVYVPGNYVTTLPTRVAATSKYHLIVNDTADGRAEEDFNPYLRANSLYIDTTKIT